MKQIMRLGGHLLSKFKNFINLRPLVSIQVSINYDYTVYDFLKSLGALQKVPKVLKNLTFFGVRIVSMTFLLPQPRLPPMQMMFRNAKIVTETKKK